MLEKAFYFCLFVSIYIIFYFINDKETTCRTVENIFSASSATKLPYVLKQIHFIRSWPQKDWDAPTLCAVYSAANNNPNFTIIVHILSNLSFPPEWEHLTNIEIRPTSLGDVFQLFVDTPLLQWYPEFLMKATNDVRILSDAMRMAIVHRYGGIYMDTDVIVQKPVDELWCNSVVYQNANETINNAIFCFEAGHPIPYFAMEIQAKQIDDINGDGPSQLTQALEKYQQLNRSDYKIIETGKLFPVPYWEYRRFYLPANDTKLVDDATVVHFWKYMLVNIKMPWIVNERSLLFLIMRKHCPPVIPVLGREGRAWTPKLRKFKEH